jgi:RNA polymerase sigma factor (sigma-70 family)
MRPSESIGTVVDLPAPDAAAAAAAAAPSDHELLRRYAQHARHDPPAAHAAFAQLVERHVNFVYAVAVRRVRGDRHLAEDVAQAVFLILAKKAGQIGPKHVVSNWLFCTTRYAAANALKREARRKHYEREHRLMTPQDAPAATAADTTTAAVDARCDAAAVAPLLDAALDALGRRDREAVLLKYVDGRSHRDVGATLGISEEAARKRLARAVERLRGALSAAGVTASAGAVATALSTQSAAAAAPAELAGVIATSVATGGAAAGAGAASISGATLTQMALAKLKVIACAVGIAVGGAAGGVAIQRAWSPPAERPLAQAPQPQPPTPRSPAVPPIAPPAAKTIEGVIQTPEETPAVGAEVFVVVKEGPQQRAERLQWEVAMRRNPRAAGRGPGKQAARVDVYTEQWPAGAVSTDADGRFSFPAPPAGLPWVILARHATGYVEVTGDKFATLDGQLFLQSWGHVKGQLLVGATPQPNVTVNLFRDGSEHEWQAMQVRHYLTAKTDAEGRFEFKEVAAGEAWLSRLDTSRGLRSGRHTLIDVKSGATTAAQIGGRGRPVVGRAAVKPTNDPATTLEWVDKPRKQSVEGSYHRADRPHMTMPAGWERMPKEELTQLQRQWERTTPAGRLSRERQWAEQFAIRPDGTFRIDDLAPGKYQIQLRMWAYENNFGIDQVHASADFEVPPLPPGTDRLDEPLDVGTVPVKTIPRLAVGKPAPDFTVTALDGGKPIKLSDLRGKTVVLKWWWNWSRMETEAAAINKAHVVLAKHPDAVLLTLGFDSEIETTRKRVADWKLAGLHAFAGPDYTKAVPEEYFGSPSTMCIIAPDGTVRAKNLNADDAETEVAKAMLER